jgi:hypothetical protein
MTITSDEFDQLKDLIKVAVQEVIDDIGVVTKSDISHLPTKDDFYEETSRLYKKMEDIETEKDILSAHSSNHSDRLEKLEKIHPHYKHSSV